MKLILVGSALLSLVACHVAPQSTSSQKNSDSTGGETQANSNTLVEKMSFGSHTFYVSNRLNVQTEVGKNVECENALGKLEINFNTVTGSGLYSPMIHLCTGGSDGLMNMDSYYYDVKDVVFGAPVAQRQVASVVYEKTLDGTTTIVPVYFELLNFEDDSKQLACHNKYSNQVQGLFVNGPWWDYDRKDVCSYFKELGFIIDISADLKYLEISSASETDQISFKAYLVDVPPSTSFPK